MGGKKRKGVGVGKGGGGKSVPLASLPLPSDVSLVVLLVARLRVFRTLQLTFLSASATVTRYVGVLHH